MTHHLKPVTKVGDKLKGMLNDTIAREIAVFIQYMWQHVQVIGVKGIAAQDQFKKTAITELKHAEGIDERLWYLEGPPTTQPSAITVGGSLKGISRTRHEGKGRGYLYSKVRAIMTLPFSCVSSFLLSLTAS